MTSHTDSQAEPRSCLDTLYESYRSTHISPHHGTDKARIEAFREFKWNILPLVSCPRDAPIVEVGCGAGHVLQCLKDGGWSNVCGVDLAAEQVEAARAAGLTEVEAGSAVPFLRGLTGVHLIVAIDFIEHLNRDEVMAFLGAVRNALTPGGELLLRLPNLASPLGCAYQHNDATHVMGYSPRSLAQLLRACAFDRIRFRPVRPPRDCVVSTVRYGLLRLLDVADRVRWLVTTGTAGPPVLTPNMYCIAGVSVSPSV